MRRVLANRGNRCCGWFGVTPKPAGSPLAKLVRRFHGHPGPLSVGVHPAILPRLRRRHCL